MVYLPLCVLGTRVSCAKMAELIIWRLTHMEPRNHILDGGPDALQEWALLRGTTSTRGRQDCDGPFYQIASNTC